jgi:hypothetical protein
MLPVNVTGLNAPHAAIERRIQYDHVCWYLSCFRLDQEDVTDSNVSPPLCVPRLHQVIEVERDLVVDGFLGFESVLNSKRND